MSEKRYHVYISTSVWDDVKPERLKLENTLLNLGVFPWEFNEPRTSLNTALARRQIDDCDYVIFLLGGRYGDLSASGISYMHLDFLYAMNKQKNIISFVDAHPEKRLEAERENDPEMLKKFSAFREQLQRDSHHYAEYKNNVELERITRNTFAKAIVETPALGWTRPRNSDVLQNEIQRLRQKIAKLEESLVQARHEVHENTVKDIASDPEAEKVAIGYRAHAYQDGNLKDIYPQRDMTWMELFYVLAPNFVEPTLESHFQRILNQYLESTALDDAREILPRAHAVSRTQIDARSLQQIKLQMKWNNWIIPQSKSTSSSRVYWELTPEGQHILSESKAKKAKIRKV